jgi:beta-glucosidase
VPDDLVLVNAQNQKVVEPGEFRVMIGASYEDIRLEDSFFVSGGTKTAVRKIKSAVMMHDSDASIGQ